jgi:chitosanase
MSAIAFARTTSGRNITIAAGGVVLILIIGLFIMATKASGSFATIEAEQGTLAGGAVVGSDGAASAGKFLQFAAASSTPTTPPPTTAGDLSDPAKRQIAMMLVSSAENSSLDWKAQYGYIEYNVEGDATDNRGYTGGLVGFTSKNGDMLSTVQYYNTIAPNNILSKYISALTKAQDTSSQTGLGTAFINDWKTAAKDVKFQQAQDHEVDTGYFTPSLNQAKADKVGVLGQLIYYDAMVMHGPGDDSSSFGGIRTAALKKAKSPAQGGNETTYLNAFLDVRKAAMLAEEDHTDTTRVDTEQRTFLKNGNLTLALPLSWSTYGDPYSLTQAMLDKYMSTGKF